MDVRKDIIINVTSGLESARDDVFLSPPVVFAFRPLGMFTSTMSYPCYIVVGCDNLLVDKVLIIEQCHDFVSLQVSILQLILNIIASNTIFFSLHE